MTTVKGFLHRSESHHPILNWVLPWFVFLVALAAGIAFTPWPVALLGAIVIGGIVADHTCC